MKKLLKENNINEPPSAFKGNANKAKRDALPEDVREYYLKTYNPTRSSNMDFKKREYIDNL